jgi:DNA repair exonuclease SbcCD ATPase subunit
MHILVLENGGLVARRMRVLEQDALKKRANDNWFGYYQNVCPRLLSTQSTSRAPHPPSPAATPTISPTSAPGPSNKRIALQPPAPEDTTSGFVTGPGHARKIRLHVNKTKRLRTDTENHDIDDEEDDERPIEEGDAFEDDGIVDGEEFAEYMFVSKAIFRKTKKRAVKSEDHRRKARALLETNKELQGRAESTEKLLQGTTDRLKAAEQGRQEELKQKEEAMARENECKELSVDTLDAVKNLLERNKEMSGAMVQHKAAAEEKGKALEFLELQNRALLAKNNLAEGAMQKVKAAEEREAVIRAQLESTEKELALKESEVKTAKEEEKAAREEVRLVRSRADEMDEEWGKKQRAWESFQEIMTGRKPSGAE